jgi:hypothetical protein
MNIEGAIDPSSGLPAQQRLGPTMRWSARRITNWYLKLNSPRFQAPLSVLTKNEEHGPVAARSAALGDRDRPGPRPHLQLHPGARSFGDPVDPAAAQVAGHLLGIARHQDLASVMPTSRIRGTT